MLIVLAVVVTAAVAYAVGRRQRAQEHPVVPQPPAASSRLVPAPLASVAIEAIEEEEPFVPAVVELSDDSGSLMTFRPAPSVPAAKPLPPNLLARLSPLIPHVLPAMREIPAAAGEVGRIVFSPALMQGLKDGSFELMKSKEVAGAVRLNVINSVGKKIVGQGQVIPADKLAAVGAMSFQLVSFAVGQAHLAQINKQLIAINTKLDGIMTWLEQQEKSRLTGAMKYMEDVSHIIREGRLTPVDIQTYNNKLEDHWAMTMEVEEAVVARKATALERLKGVEMNKMMRGAKADEQNLREAFEAYRKVAHVHELVLWVRRAVLDLKDVLPVAPADRRRRVLDRHVKLFAAELKEAAIAAHNKSRELSGAFRMAETLQEMRARIQSEVTSHVHVMTTSSNQLLAPGPQVEATRAQIAQHGLEIEMRYVPGKQEPKLFMIPVGTDNLAVSA